MSSIAIAQENQLLASLPGAELVQWLPSLELVDLALGMVLCEANQPQRSVYFPTSAAISLQQPLMDGTNTEVAVVGFEGLVGVSVLMGGLTTTTEAIVHQAGQGLRLGARFLRDRLDQSSPARLVMLRYTQALLTQMAQLAVCNRHHSLDQQLSRWLLQNLDRMKGHEFVMTQEVIASRLGVRREGVTLAALKLQAAGAIQYARGHISVIDRAELQKRCCECYEVVKKEYDRLLSSALPLEHCARILDGASPDGGPTSDGVLATDGRYARDAPMHVQILRGETASAARGACQHH